MRTWTATTTTAARPEAVLDVLTDPEAAARWAPLPFDVEDLDGRRLATGSRARISGKLAGRRVGFDLEVHEASGDGLSLAASGPVGFDVDYRLAAVERRQRGARVRVRPPIPAGSWGACSPRRRAPCCPPVPWKPLSRVYA